MRFVTLLAFTFPFAIAIPHEHNIRQGDLDKRAGVDVGLRKRFSDAKFTFYEAGMGACGRTNENSDFIVALNKPQYGSGSDCFKTITITVNGKTHSATIVDECEGCPEGGLDMSPALFDYFGSASAGILHGEWEFGNGGDESSTSSKTTHTHASHTHSHTTHSTSSTKKSALATTHSSTSTSTSTSSTPSATSINYFAGDASGLAVPTGAVTPGTANTINDFNQAIIGLGALVVAGRNAN